MSERQWTAEDEGRADRALVERLFAKIQADLPLILDHVERARPMLVKTTTSELALGDALAAPKVRISDEVVTADHGQVNYTENRHYSGDGQESRLND